MSLIGKIFRWLFCLLGLSFLLVLLLLILVSFVHIPIDLTGKKSLIESLAGNAFGRAVSLDGTIIVTTSLNPSFSIQDVRIANPEGFGQGDFVTVKSARVQISIMPLLHRKIHLREIRGRGMHVTLLENEKGENNWTSSEPETKYDQREKQDRRRIGDKIDLAPDTLVIDKLVLEDIALSFKSGEMNDFKRFSIRQCNGSVQPGNPTSLVMDGSWQMHPFTVNMKIGSLQELLEQDRSWMEITTEIAETDLYFAGTIDLVTVLDSLNLKSRIQGSQLDSLNELVGFELPSLQSYKVEADLTLRRKLITLNKLQLKVGQSSLEGKMVVDARKEKPDVQITMAAPLIQLNDFDLDSMSGSKSQNENSDDDIEEKAEKASREQDSQVKQKEDDDNGALASLLAQEFFKQFSAAVNIQLEQVLSGEDSLGAGNLNVVLDNGRVTVDPVQLHFPGGSLQFSMSFLPGEATSEATLSIKAENFDFGILARKAKPETDMGGTLNLDIDLQSSGGNLTEILANGNGYIDFSARPVNLNSGIMDLWVVNLLAAIIFRSDTEGAPVNCLLSRWSMKDGLLTPDAFAVDTGIMRICGSGKIDLKSNSIDVRISPAPKRKQFFSLATPFGIQGKITDINMGIAPGGLIGTTIRFVASPVTVPLSWLLTQKIPEDGSDICTMAIGPDNRPEKKLPGCR